MSNKWWGRKHIKQIIPESGFSYLAKTGLPALSADRHPSPAWVLENGNPLPGPANQGNDPVSASGNGRFNFSGDCVFFSASDNSDPRLNGRSYAILYPIASNVFTDVLFRFLPGLQIQRSPASDAHFADALKRDIEYAAHIAQDYVSFLPAGWASLAGKTVLELGPGSNYGAALLMACFNAQVHVADPYLTPWNDLYHPAFYRLLRDWVKANLPAANLTPLSRIIAANAYDPRAIGCHLCSAETLDDIADQSVDLIFSNAVLEHVGDVHQAIENLARVSRAGSQGFHQVDFRYHRMFERPLEFLLTADAEFADEFARCHGECGNRLRPFEYITRFEEAGFDVDCTPTMFANEDYLGAFHLRLRDAADSRYRNLTAVEIKVISGRFKTLKR